MYRNSMNAPVSLEEKTLDFKVRGQHTISGLKQATAMLNLQGQPGLIVLSAHQRLACANFHHRLTESLRKVETKLSSKVG